MAELEKLLDSDLGRVSIAKISNKITARTRETYFVPDVGLSPNREILQARKLKSAGNKSIPFWQYQLPQGS